MPKDQPSQPAATLGSLCREAPLTTQVIAIVVGEQALSLVHRDDSQSHIYPARWSGLLAFSPGLGVLKGEARIVSSVRNNLVKLQAFIDQAAAPAADSSAHSLASLPVPLESLNGTKALERWYIAHALTNADALAGFAGLLRRGESYRLVCFLLAQSAASEKLCSLARTYGVSTSHFRRLCHEALGGAAKPEMREWRTAQALLAMARGKQSLTDVALEFGFASSSHFSKEIRELVGVKPSSLIDITRLSSK